MKKKIILLVLILFFGLTFTSFVFADLYIVKDQGGKVIAITNQDIFKIEYQELGYTFELWFKQTESTLTLDILIKDLESQIKRPETEIDRNKMVEVFKIDALVKWGDDYKMVNYEIEKQTEAYNWIIKQTKYPNIIERAEKGWGNDYAMVKYEYERQVSAYEWINQQTAYPEIMVKAKQKWDNDYKMVKYEYEGQVKAYENL